MLRGMRGIMITQTVHAPIDRVVPDAVAEGPGKCLLMAVTSTLYVHIRKHLIKHCMIMN